MDDVRGATMPLLGIDAVIAATRRPSSKRKGRGGNGGHCWGSTLSKRRDDVKDKDEMCGVWNSFCFAQTALIREDRESTQFSGGPLLRLQKLHQWPVQGRTEGRQGTVVYLLHFMGARDGRRANCLLHLMGTRDGRRVNSLSPI